MKCEYFATRSRIYGQTLSNVMALCNWYNVGDDVIRNPCYQDLLNPCEAIFTEHGSANFPLSIRAAIHELQTRFGAPLTNFAPAV